MTNSQAVASRALWDFSRSSKHCIHLYTTKTIYFSASFLQCPHLHQSRFPVLICNKSAAEAWICLVFFLVVLIPVDIAYSNMQENSSWSIRLISEAAGKSRPATLFKKNLWHRCFSVNFEKFLRTPFFTEHFWWGTSGDLLAFLCD